LERVNSTGTEVFKYYSPFGQDIKHLDLFHFFLVGTNYWNGEITLEIQGRPNFVLEKYGIMRPSFRYTFYPGKVFMSYSFAKNTYSGDWVSANGINIPSEQYELLIITGLILDSNFRKK
jgi:hypothetical protein